MAPQPEDLQRSTEGRRIKIDYTYKIKGNDFESLGKLDFGELDTSYAQEVFESNEPKKLTKTIKKLPSGFYLMHSNAPCKVNFSAELN